MILAIDIGGTKTLVALMDDTGAIINQTRFETHSVYQEFLSHLLKLIKEQFWQPDIRAIGLAAPGVVDEQTKVFTRFGNLPWRNVDIGAALKQAFSIPVIVDNDANVAGLFSIRRLSPIPLLGLYITIGTGIGTGIITHGHIDTNLARSEGGHMVLPWKGSFSTWEDIASGRAIVRDFQKFAYEIQEPALWEEIAERIVLGLLVLVPTLQPDIVTFGGGIGTHFPSYRQQLEQKLHDRLPPLVTMPQLLQAAHPEEAVIYGCYELALETFPA